VTREEIVDLARLLFRPEGMALSLLGDFKDEIKIKNLDPDH
jgi:hypothetical protein